MGKSNILEKRSSLVIIALFCCIIWGSEVPLIKLSYAVLQINGTFEVILIAGLRLALAGAGVLAFRKIKMRKKIAISRKELPFTLLIAFIQTFAALACFYIGIAGTTGVKSSILAATSVFVVTLFAHFMFKSDRLTWIKTTGLILGFSGVILVNINMIDETVFSFRFMGEGMILLAVLLTSLATVLIRKRSDSLDIIKLNGWQLLFGGAGLTAAGFIGSSNLPSFTAAFWGVVLVFAIFSGVTLTLWFALLKYHNASTLELHKFVVPLMGSLLSALILPGEHLTIYILIAAALVSIGTVIGNWQRRKRV